MSNRFSPEAILSSPEKAELVEAIEKAKAVHIKIKEVDDQLMASGAVHLMVHDEIVYDPLSGDATCRLLGLRMALVEELEQLSMSQTFIPVSVDVEGPGDW